MEEIARIVGRIRAAWPRVKVLLRADSGFAREELMAWAEANDVDYVFGLARNARLVDRIYIDLAWAEEAAQRSGRPERRFADFRWTTRDSWSRRRRVVAKAEWMPGRGEGGANPRFVVTSLKPREIAARPLYEKLYCARGDMENRIKECQLDLFADRTSAATMRANQLRLWFASMAYALLSALRRRALAAHRARPRHLRHHPGQAAQDRRAGDRQCPARPRRHGLRLSLRRRLPPRASPIMRLTRRHRPARSPSRNPPTPPLQRPRPAQRTPASPPPFPLPIRRKSCLNLTYSDALVRNPG